MNSKSAKAWIYISTILTVIYITHSFFRGFLSYPYSSIITPLILTPFAFIHGSIFYGFKKMVIFFFIITLVSWGYENISIITGFPFGYYQYSNQLGIKIWHVPVAIMPTYFSFGYLSWSITHSLLRKSNSKTTKLDIFQIPALAAFIMTAWDLTMDPINSTIHKLWTWRSGGEYFGVPLQNFLGWYICVYTFYLFFAVINHKSYLNNTICSKTYWLLPPIIYGSMMIKYATGYWFRQREIVYSMDGSEWLSDNIYGSMLLISFWVTLPIIMTAAYKIIKNS